MVRWAWDWAIVSFRPWPFLYGFGFSDLNLHVSSGKTAEFSLDTTFKVQNVGAVAGKEVAQLYVIYPTRANEPPKVLKDSKTRIALSRTQILGWAFLLQRMTFRFGTKSQRIRNSSQGCTLCLLGNRLVIFSWRRPFYWHEKLFRWPML